jgi:hypothetical protein
MEETIVFECSQGTAKNVRSNGDYTNVFPSAAEMNEGDMLSIQMASIDVQQTNSQSIVIPEDTQVTMAYGFWDVNMAKSPTVGTAPTDLRQQQQGGNVVDFNRYFMTYHETVTATGTSFTAIYTGQGNGQYVDGVNEVRITMECAWIDTNSQLQTGTFIFDSRTDPSPDNPASGLEYNMFPADKGAFNFLIQTYSSAIGFGSLAVTKVSGLYGYPTPNQPLDLFMSATHGSNVKIAHAHNRHPNLVFNNNAGNHTVLMTNTITIEQGTYDPSSLAVIMNQKLNTVQLLNTADDASYNAEYLYTTNNRFMLNLFATGAVNNNNPPTNYPNIQKYRFYNPEVGTGAGFFHYQKPHQDNPLPDTIATRRTALNVGADNVVFEYGKSGQVFQLSQCHTPLVGFEAGPQVDGVQTYKSNGTPVVMAAYEQGRGFYNVNESCGIYFTDLQPASFWENVLGLRSKLLVNLVQDPVDANVLLPRDINRKITQGPFVLSNSCPLLDRGGIIPTLKSAKNPGGGVVRVYETPAHTTFNVSGIDNIAVIGNPPQAMADQSGVFLVEVNGAGLNSHYLSSDGSRMNVGGIVSKQYIQSNTVTGFSGDTTIPYVHRGNPVRLTSLDIRILDGTTKKVDTLLGEKNVIYLKLTKRVTPSAQQLAKEAALAKQQQKAIKRK